MKPLALAAILYISLPLAGLAQDNRWFDFLPRLKQFLNLTDQQVTAILNNNEEYNRWGSEKQRRMVQVQTEIADETARATLDPMALGLRYVEIEAICRQFREEAAKHNLKNVGVLTDTQRAKLKTLEDAWNLFPVISEAQSVNLLANPIAPMFFNTPFSRTDGTLIGGVIGLFPGCSVVGAPANRLPFGNQPNTENRLK